MSKKKNDIIFGLRPIIEAIKSGKSISKVQIQKGNTGNLSKELLSVCQMYEIPFQFIPSEKFSQFRDKNHQGVMAHLSPIDYQDIEQILPIIYEKGEDPFILILDGISDVRNFGAIVRTAACSGVHAIMIPDKGSASINADAIKTSAGALYTVPICRSNSLTKSVEILKNNGLQMVAATEKSDELYTSISYTKPTAIIMGAEDEGVSKNLLHQCDFLVRIPILGTISSLNVSVACGILLYETLRQKQI